MRVGVDRVAIVEENGTFKHVGTIDTIVITNASLSIPAFIRATVVVIEAKVIALHDLDIRSSYAPDLQATGTGTDNLVMASLGMELKVNYVSGHVKIGEIIARAVTLATKDAIIKCRGGNRTYKTRIYHVSFHEALGSASLFFYGCNFKCKGCLRRVYMYDCHLNDFPKTGRLRFLTINELMEILKKIKSKTVVFEGWEPTLDPMLAKIADSIRCNGMRTVLLTNGYLYPPTSSFDEIKVSIKAFSRQVHVYYTGKSNKRVLENFKSIYENAPKKLSAETVLIPNLVDIDEIVRIAKFISSVNPAIHLRIDGYWPVVPNTPWRAPTREEVISAVIRARRYLENVQYLSSDIKVIGRVYSLWPIE